MKYRKYPNWVIITNKEILFPYSCPLMGTDADSMVWVIPCDDHSSGFRVGLPLVCGFEWNRLVPNHRTEASSC
jgi:hypothetical protein